jgi:hypothetical protein
VAHPTEAVGTAHDSPPRARERALHLDSGDLTRPDVRSLGRALFDMVIRGDVRRLFDRATHESQIATDRAQARLVSVEITVDDSALALWPWEYMWDDTAKKFICQEFHPICRGLLQVEPAAASHVLDRLRILLLVGC